MLPTEATLCQKHALVDHIESLLAVHGFFNRQMILMVQDCLYGYQVENVVVNKQDHRRVFHET